MPESGLPIRVYKEHDMWHADYGEGVIEVHASEEEATSAADACGLPSWLPALRSRRVAPGCEHGEGP